MPLNVYSNWFNMIATTHTGCFLGGASCSGISPLVRLQVINEPVYIISELALYRVRSDPYDPKD